MPREREVGGWWAGGCLGGVGGGEPKELEWEDREIERGEMRRESWGRKGKGGRGGIERRDNDK